MRQDSSRRDETVSKAGGVGGKGCRREIANLRCAKYCLIKGFGRTDEKLTVEGGDETGHKAGGRGGNAVGRKGCARMQTANLRWWNR